MSSGYFAVLTRRAAAILACLLFAVGAGLWTGPHSAATVTRSAGHEPPSASRADVLQELGVGDIRAEIVILIDISGSMASDSLYAAIRRDVPAFMAALKKDDPNDLVGVIFFGGPHDDKVIIPGRPDPSIWLPAQPNSQETDFGHAFESAYNLLLGGVAQHITVGGVLLLSDGEVSMPFNDDPTYGSSGFTAPGWKKLRAKVHSLPMAITGYDVPLTGKSEFVGNQNEALSHVFYPVETLPSGTTDLSHALDLAKLRITNRKVAKAAAHDNGQGVHVSWGELQGDHGKPLDLAARHADVTITLTAATQHVPLYLSGLSITSVGLPVTMRGTVPGGRSLRAGQRAIVRVRLSWTPSRDGMTWMGDPRRVHGASLKLDAAVSSPFTPTLRSDFADSAFSAGGLRGATSPLFTALEPVQWSVLLMLLAVLGAIALLGGGVAFRARMTGRLLLSTVDKASGEVWLHGLPWLSCRTQKLIGKPGRVTVHGSMRRREIRYRLRIPDRDPFDGALLPGEPEYPGGIKLMHEPRNKRGLIPRRRTGPDEP